MERLETKAAFSVTDTGEIEGIAWPFGSPDSVNEWVEKGAFASAPHNLPMLFGHDQLQPVGVWDSVIETAQGLIVKGRLLIESVQRAREIHALVKANALTGLSIGFKTVTAKPIPRGRRITALDLKEISIVSVPSHPNARVLSVKSDVGDASQFISKDQKMENPNTEIEIEAKADPVIDQKSFDAMKARLDKLEAKANRPQPSNNNQPRAMNDNGDNLERKAFTDYIRSGRIEEKALAYGTTTGGVLAPEQVSTSIIEKLAEYSPVRQLASAISMSGPLLQLPRLVDEVDPAPRAETAAAAEDEPSFEQIDLKPFEMAITVPVTRILLEDAQIDLESYLSGHIARRFGQKEAAWFINGNGTTQAEGVLTSAEIADHQVEQINADALIDTFYSIKTGYSQRGSWLMNRATMAVVRKLKDTDGSYLWQPSIAADVPPTLLGRPVLEAVDMPNVAAEATPIIFGDFQSGYTIADRVGFTTIRDELTGADNGIIKLRARRRVGGRVVLGEALTKLRIAA
nr:phage major capsid protein [Brucella intermedia]